MLQACRGGGAYYGSYQVWMARYIIRTPIKQEMSEKGLEDEGSARTNTTFFSGLAEKRSSLPFFFFKKKIQANRWLVVLFLGAFYTALVTAHEHHKMQMRRESPP